MTVSLGPRRDGWQRPVSVPADLSALQGPVAGRVRLPLQVYSSGLGPKRVFDLAIVAERIEVYQIVLTDGRLQDVRRFLNAEELRRLWLAEHVRRAWQPLVVVAAS